MLAASNSSITKVNVNVHFSSQKPEISPRRPHHPQQDARGEGHLVERGEGASQVGGGNLLDVEWVETHDQAAEEAEHHAAQDENLKRLAGFGGGHQTRSHNREAVHYEDGVSSGREDEGREKTQWRLWGQHGLFFSPALRICQVFDSQRAQQGSEVFDADGERQQESEAVIWHRLVVPDSPGVVEKLFNDLNSERKAKDDQETE